MGEERLLTLISDLKYRARPVIADQSYLLLPRLEPAWTFCMCQQLTCLWWRGQSTQMKFTDQSLQINQVYAGLNHRPDSGTNLHGGDGGYGAE